MAILLFSFFLVKYLDVRIMRVIEKSIKGINNSVFTAEPEQQVVNKI